MATDKTKASEESQSEETQTDPKCANHPHRKAKTYSQGIEPIHLCDECAPSWLVADEDD